MMEGMFKIGGGEQISCEIVALEKEHMIFFSMYILELLGCFEGSLEINSYKFKVR